jgi:aryl-alcohol dehydrogenase-like predicted oxidoreductase
LKYRKVGKSGLKVSEISLGSWLTYGDKVDKKTAFEIFNTAVDHGINFIDSAEIYAKGGAEVVIGEWLREGTVDRDDLVISTKVFWPMSDNINRWGLSRKNIFKAITGSIARLGTTPDILYMHRYDYQTPLTETVKTLNDLVEQGKIHYWGTSAWSAAQLERAHAIAKEYGYHRPIVEQPMYNMLFRHIELEIMPTARNLGMGFTVFSPLGGGILTGKYNEGIPEGSRATWADFVKNNLTEENIEKVKKITEIARSLELSTSQLALAWILRRKELSSAITGATKPSHLLDNIKGSDVALSATTIAEIEEILDNAPQWPATYQPNLYHQDEMRSL